MIDVCICVFNKDFVYNSVLTEKKTWNVVTISKRSFSLWETIPAAGKTVKIMENYTTSTKQVLTNVTAELYWTPVYLARV